MSASEPCPECKGKCCRDSYRYKLPHMGDEFYEHVCDACEDGTKYAPPRTALDERRDVLAWLADQARLPGGSPDEKNMLNWIARAIFGMEHVGAATKGGS